MDRTETLLAARSALAENTARVTNLLRTQQDLSAPAGNGSTWQIRDAAVHLVVVASVYAEIAGGTPSPVTDVSPEYLAPLSAALNADIPETAPDKVAALLQDAVDR